MGALRRTRVVMAGTGIVVFAAALSVFGTGTRWPYLGVALVMGGLALSSGIAIIRQARNELSEAEPHNIAQ